MFLLIAFLIVVAIGLCAWVILNKFTQELSSTERKRDGYIVIAIAVIVYVFGVVAYAYIKNNG